MKEPVRIIVTSEDDVSESLSSTDDAFGALDTHEEREEENCPTDDQELDETNERTGLMRVAVTNNGSFAHVSLPSVSRPRALFSLSSAPTTGQQQKKRVTGTKSAGGMLQRFSAAGGSGRKKRKQGLQDGRPEEIRAMGELEKAQHGTDAVQEKPQKDTLRIHSTSLLIRSASNCAPVQGTISSDASSILFCKKTSLDSVRSRASNFPTAASVPIFSAKRQRYGSTSVCDGHIPLDHSDDSPPTEGSNWSYGGR